MSSNGRAATDVAYGLTGIGMAIGCSGAFMSTFTSTCTRMDSTMRGILPRAFAVKAAAASTCFPTNTLASGVGIIGGTNITGDDDCLIASIHPHSRVVFGCGTTGAKATNNMGMRISTDRGKCAFVFGMSARSGAALRVGGIGT